MKANTETMTPGPWQTHTSPMRFGDPEDPRFYVKTWNTKSTVAEVRGKANAQALSQVPYMIQALQELVAEHDAGDDDDTCYQPDTAGIMFARHALKLAGVTA